MSWQLSNSESSVCCLLFCDWRYKNSVLTETVSNELSSAPQRRWFQRSTDGSRQLDTLQFVIMDSLSPLSWSPPGEFGLLHFRRKCSLIVPNTTKCAKVRAAVKLKCNIQLMSMTPPCGDKTDLWGVGKKKLLHPQTMFRLARLFNSLIVQMH